MTTIEQKIPVDSVSVPIKQDPLRLTTVLNAVPDQCRDLTGDALCIGEPLKDIPQVFSCLHYPSTTHQGTLGSSLKSAASAIIALSGPGHGGLYFRCHTSPSAHHGFSCIVPAAWNSLPLHSHTVSLCFEQHSTEIIILSARLWKRTRTHLENTIQNLLQISSKNTLPCELLLLLLLSSIYTAPFEGDLL